MSPFYFIFFNSSCSLLNKFKIKNCISFFNIATTFGMKFLKMTVGIQTFIQINRRKKKGYLLEINL